VELIVGQTFQLPGFERYGRHEWGLAIRELRDLGFSRDAVVRILQSELVTWTVEYRLVGTRPRASDLLRIVEDTANAETLKRIVGR
jgi:hypothetical protein